MTVRVLDLILGEPWAITPEGMEQVLAIAQRANDAPEAVVAKLGRPLDNTREVRVRGRTAIVPVTGPIFRRANLFTELSGATSVEVLATDIGAALEDPAIDAVLLEVDSPGGQAAGISELAGLIHDADKPVFAHSDGQAASAGYWLAASAKQLTVSASGLLGSIGVVVSYRPQKDAPIEVISSQSPMKRATPETEAGRSEIQRVVDDMAAVFVADVARYRGVKKETVLSDFGRGGMLVGLKAVQVGMADAVSSLEQVLSLCASDPARSYHFGAASAGKTGDNLMSRIPEALAEALGIPADASADAAIEAVGKLKTDRKPREDEIAKARQEGAQAEQQRIFGIIEHTEAEGRLPVAVKIAKVDAMTAESAAAVMASLPKADAHSKQSSDDDPLGKAMSRMGNASVQGEGEGSVNDQDVADKLWDQAISSHQRLVS